MHYYRVTFWLTSTLGVVADVPAEDKTSAITQARYALVDHGIGLTHEALLASADVDAEWR